jgi:multidrug efflux pump subunit AcrB
VNPADAPVLTLALSSEVQPLRDLQSLADTRLAPKISQLPGVGLVSISGGQKPAVRVQANPMALSAYGLGLPDLRQAIYLQVATQQTALLTNQRAPVSLTARQFVTAVQLVRSLGGGWNGDLTQASLPLFPH